MLKKIIGIDIDGVITDEGHCNGNIWHNALCDFLGHNLKRVCDTYDFDQAYNLKNDIINDFLKEHEEKIYRQIRPAKKARDTIDLFIQKGFEIHLITARETRFQEITENWLRENKISYSTLTHTRNKTPLAIKKGIRLFIEDKASTALELSKYGIFVILFSRYHNQHLKGNSNIIHANNWLEIKENILNYYKI